MRLSEEWLRDEWLRIVRDAGLGEERIQLVVVRERQPSDAAEAAYWAPSFHGPLDRAGIYTIVRRLSDLAEAEHHLVVVWEELPDAYDAVASALLRHEAEHAAQWERYGPPLFDDLDTEVQRVAQLSGRDYADRPSERAADDAARDYVRRRYGEQAVEPVGVVLVQWERAEEGARHLSVRQEMDEALRVWAPAGHQVEIEAGRFGTVEEFLDHLGPGGPLRPNPHYRQAIVFID